MSNAGRTFDMSGGPKGVKRPLDVRSMEDLGDTCFRLCPLDKTSGLREDDLPQAIVQFIGVRVPTDEADVPQDCDGISKGR